MNSPFFKADPSDQNICLPDLPARSPSFIWDCLICRWVIRGWRDQGHHSGPVWGRLGPFMDRSRVDASFSRRWGAWVIKSGISLCMVLLSLSDCSFAVLWPSLTFVTDPSLLFQGLHLLQQASLFRERHNGWKWKDSRKWKWLCQDQRQRVYTGFWWVFYHIPPCLLPNLLLRYVVKPLLPPYPSHPLPGLEGSHPHAHNTTSPGCGESKGFINARLRGVARDHPPPR